MPEHEIYGESMALVAAMLFAWTAVLFTAAGRRLGVTAVNLLRMPLGAVCLSLTHLALTGRPWPAGLHGSAQVWLALSGVAGLAIGDSALFHAFTTIGPRRGLMLMATAPVFTVVAAWFLLGERLGPLTLAGIVVVIGGVLLAVAGREPPTAGTFGDLSPAVLRAGLGWGLVAAAGQGLGSAFAKLGMHDLDPLGATLVRMTWAAIVAWAFLLPSRRLRRAFGRLDDRRGLAALAGAILLGPFVSVWVSLVAIKNAPAGVAQVLLGTVPIFVILPAWLVYRDRPSALSLTGVVIAVAGGALLFLV